LDAIFISSHGAALTSQEDDPDGILFECVRRIVGPYVPVVAVLDLHTNLSHRMTSALSAGVAYKTNPHTDLHACGQEGARHLRTLLTQGGGEVALVKLPFAPPATSQLVEPGRVYAELIAAGQTYLDEDILNVSLCAGFALADCSKCGFGVMLTARAGQRDKAEQVARKLAQQVWQSRSRFVSQLTSLHDAVQTAVATDATGPALILADLGDNPGGGGGGQHHDVVKSIG
jgi:microcystin degradation protein MlrC